VTIASASENCCSPNSSIFGFVPQYESLRLKIATLFFWNLTRLNGPDPTTGALFGNVFRLAPLLPVCCAQMCCGRMKNCWNWPSTHVGPGASS
jgi:hypothetical protein